MQGFTYENQGQNTYLVYQFDDRPIDTMALGMLTNNKIKGFAPAIYTEIDNQKFIKYNVSSHVTLSKLFMGDVRKMRLLKTFVNIVDAMQMLDAYMLDRRTIMLDRDYIYVDASTSDVSMICVPVVDEFAPIDEREFFKNIIFSVSFAANENGDYVARILAYLNSVELFQLQDFKKMLEGLMSEQPAVGMQNVQPAMGAPYTQNNPYQQTPAGAPAQPQTEPLIIQPAGSPCTATEQTDRYWPGTCYTECICILWGECKGYKTGKKRGNAQTAGRRKSQRDGKESYSTGEC